MKELRFHVIGLSFCRRLEWLTNSRVGVFVQTAALRWRAKEAYHTRQPKPDT